MKAIIVDDEPLMLRKFVRLTEDIEEIDIIKELTNGKEALEFASSNEFNIAFLDIDMPVMNGITLAKKLRQINRNLIIVFVTAYDDYIKESNELGGDYYLIKPYSRQSLRLMADNLKLLKAKQEKDIFIETFGRFVVKKNGHPIDLTGKAKKILAMVVSRRGQEISNEEIYSTIWEERPYSNSNMTVYYNALRRLKEALEKEQVRDLLISTKRGQMANTDIFDCDYYEWLENPDNVSFYGEFLSEYSWGENILADIVSNIK